MVCVVVWWSVVVCAVWWWWRLSGSFGGFLVENIKWRRQAVAVAVAVAFLPPPLLGIRPG